MYVNIINCNFNINGLSPNIYYINCKFRIQNIIIDVIMHFHYNLITVNVKDTVNYSVLYAKHVVLLYTGACC
jgi:hypothetical protein